MHPGLKIFSFIFLLIITFLPNGFLGLIILFSWTILLYAISLINLKHLLKIISFVGILILILFIIDWFTYRWSNEITSLNEDAILWGHLSGQYFLYYGQITYTLFSFSAGTWYQLNIYSVVIIVYVFVKILIVIMLIQLLVRTTSDVDMTNGFNLLLKPLTYLKIPTAALSLIFALTIKFIPNLYIQAKQIRLAQKARGSLQTKNKFSRYIKNYIGIIIPLFALAFESAETISDAMLIKGYNLKNKKHYFYKYKFHYFDYLLGLISLGIIVLLIYMIASHIFFAPFGIADSIVINGISSM